MKDGDGRYISGQINELSRADYYKEVIRLLLGMKRGETYAEELTMTEYRIIIDDLMEDL